jgi:hypothetical protein
MSKTPRTDAIRDLLNADSLSDDISTLLEHADMLEQELNQWKSCATELAKSLDQISVQVLGDKEGDAEWANFVDMCYAANRLIDRFNKLNK